MSVYVEEITRADCRKNRFTGLRSDRILNNLEIWRDGVLVYDCPGNVLAANPEQFRKAYADAFGLYEDQVVIEHLIPKRLN